MSRSKPRRCRRARLDEQSTVLQIIFLNEIAAGKREPRNDRELFYRKLLDAGHNPKVHDFILPRGLMILERMRERASDPDAAAPPPHPRHNAASCG